MSAIEQPAAQQPAAQAIGWALLHFVWQGRSSACLTALALAALRRSAADVRYVVAAIGLSLMLTLPAVTAVQLWRTVGRRRQPSLRHEQRRPHESHCRLSPQPSCADRSAAPTRRPTAAASSAAGAALDPCRRRGCRSLVLAWLFGVACCRCGLMSGWLWVQRMKSHGTSPAPTAGTHIADAAVAAAAHCATASACSNPRSSTCRR